MDSGKTVMVKAHRQIKKNDGAVLLIRNPFDAILAEFNRNHGGGHTGHAKRKGIDGIICALVVGTLLYHYDLKIRLAIFIIPVKIFVLDSPIIGNKSPIQLYT